MNSKTKIIVSLLLVPVLMFSLLSSIVLADYLPKNDDRSNHSSNIALIYTGYYNPANYGGQPIGDYDKDKFLPYVGYLDENGRANDYFFDTFLMLATTSPDGGALARYYDWAHERPGTLKDWEWAMDRMFIEDLQLDALEQAVAQISSQLGDKDKKVNVYLTMPFPDPQSKDFGDFNGDGETKNLENLDTRKELIKWYIDTMVERFNEQGYKHLNLSGFYWLQEDLDTGVPGEKESVQYTSKYLNSQGMRLGWIPWSGAGQRANGNKLGFDFSLIQPNHFFQGDTTFRRIEETADLAYANEAGVEMEFDLRAVENPWHRQAFQNYLIGGVKKGFMQDSIIAYYQDVYAVHDLYHHESPYAKQLYTDIYKFTKGVYEAPTGSFAGRVVDSGGKPIEGATLRDEAGKTVETGADGKFHMDNLFATENEFYVEKQGLSNKKVRVNVPVDAIVYQDIILKNPMGGEVEDTFSIADFEDSELKYGVNNSQYAKCSLVTDPQYVHEGNQALQVDFKALPQNWIRAYIDSDFDEFVDGSGAAYDMKDWSKYDTISISVFNPTDKPQELRLEFMHEYNWSTAIEKDVVLAPQEWTVVEQSIADMKDDGANVENMIRIALTRYDQSENVTLYFDDIRLLKYADTEQALDYAISIPSSIPTMDIGATLRPTVINRLDGDSKVDAEFTSSDSNIIQVLDDGTLKAVGVGKATIRAHVGNIEALSIVLEVSPWNINQIKGGEMPLSVGDSITLRLVSSFENGYTISPQDADYSWKIEGDAIEKIEEANGNVLKIKGIKGGEAKAIVTMTYNGKKESFEKTIQVGDSEEPKDPEDPKPVDPIEPTISQDVNGKEHIELGTREEKYNYNINVQMPENVDGYKTLEISDTLEDVLHINEAKVLVDGEEDGALTKLLAIEGQRVELSLGEDYPYESLAGKTITLQINVNVKKDADLSRYKDNKVPNVATLKLNDETMTFNTVTVKVPEIKDDGDGKGGDGKGDNDKKGNGKGGKAGKPKDKKPKDKTPKEPAKKGRLPKTGEARNWYLYLAGGILLLLGVILRRTKI